MTLKELRDEKGYTQTYVASKIGCSLTSYRLWEAEVTTPTEDNKAKIEAFLGVVSLWHGNE